MVSNWTVIHGSQERNGDNERNVSEIKYDGQTTMAAAAERYVCSEYGLYCMCGHYFQTKRQH